MGLISFLKEKFSKKDNLTDKYSSGLTKSREALSYKLNNLSHKYKSVNQDYFDDLEEILLESDVGVSLTLRTIETVIEKSKQSKVKDISSLNEILFETLFEGYVSKGQQELEISFKNGEPTILLMVGVNGVGKTTTIAKLASRYLSKGKKVLLVAADTFRAGAKEQLSVWANRLNIDIVTGKDSEDPASVVYEGMKLSKTNKYDLVIVDTAGRLQNKNNLMAELGKIKRVISKETNSLNIETLLVLDATTGQNGVIQAKAFKEVTDLTGVVITKMDGTSKGGIILSIRDELGLPIRFIGLGEGIDDLDTFDIEKYLYGLILGE